MREFRQTSIECTAETRVDSVQKFLGNIRHDPETAESTGQIHIVTGAG